MADQKYHPAHLYKRKTSSAVKRMQRLVAATVGAALIVVSVTGVALTQDAPQEPAHQVAMAEMNSAHTPNRLQERLGAWEPVELVQQPPQPDVDTVTQDELTQALAGITYPDPATRIAELEDHVAELETQLATLATDHAALAETVTTLQELVDDLTGRIAELEAQVRGPNSETTELLPIPTPEPTVQEPEITP